MSEQDFYSILGVSKTATADELKKAYRTLAMKYHPDRNPGDKDAEEKFKEVNNAYQTLSDPEKRQRYDALGHDAYVHGGASGAGAGGMDATDFFNQFFGGGAGGFSDFNLEDLFGFGGGSRSRKRRGPQKGDDLLYHLTIDFEDSVFGAEKTIRIPRMEKCEHCQGQGCEPGSSKTTCPDCHGTGQVTRSSGFFSMSQPCRRCGGTGIIMDKPCRDCHGAGAVQKTSTLTVRIPAGIDTGSRLRMAGEGAAGPQGGPNGDLYVEIEVRESDVFQRDGNDLYCDVPVPFYLACMGGTITVPTVTGPEEVNLPAGVQDGALMRLRGKGMPNARGGARGNQFARIRVEVPTSLSSAQKKALKDFAQLPQEDSQYPRQTSFRKRAGKWLKKM